MSTKHISVWKSYNQPPEIQTVKVTVAAPMSLTLYLTRHYFIHEFCYH